MVHICLRLSLGTNGVLLYVSLLTQVSLGTSKINYMDPRITVAWCKRNEVPIERVFAKTLREKFVWAMNVAPDWRFEYNGMGESAAVQASLDTIVLKDETANGDDAENESD